MFKKLLIASRTPEQPRKSVFCVRGVQHDLRSKLFTPFADGQRDGEEDPLSPSAMCHLGSWKPR